MALATKSHGLGVAAGLRTLRQIEGIVIRQKLGQRFAEDLGCLPDDASSEETQDAAINDAELLDQLESVATAAWMTTTGVAMIQSAAHTHRTGLHYYGNTQADVQQLTPATLDKALAASLAWHRFVGMDDVEGGTKTPSETCKANKSQPPHRLNAQTLVNSHSLDASGNHSSGIGLASHDSATQFLSFIFLFREIVICHCKGDCTFATLNLQ
ncbi:hypothetical protein CF319_g8872 [Tilletia indica]|nr:hypothetical protein CF319_g8872 [Tilletia indica]